VCDASNFLAGSFCYELTLNAVYAGRLNYGNGRDRYYTDTDEDLDVVNRVLYSHRTISEPKHKKAVDTINRYSVNLE